MRITMSEKEVNDMASALGAFANACSVSSQQMRKVSESFAEIGKTVGAYSKEELKSRRTKHYWYYWLAALLVILALCLALIA